MKNESTRKIINVDKCNYSPIWTYKQEDDGVLKLSLFKGSTLLDITGQTIKLGAKRPDNSIIELTNGFKINKNELDIILKNNILAIPGIVECDLEITDAAGKMTTASFYLTINKKITGKDNLDASNDISAINKIVAEVLAIGKELDGNIKVVVEEANKKITAIDTALNKKLNEMQEDYDSLQKIIIDENQAANLQAQINKSNEQLDTKATKIEVEVERQRINNLSSLDGGSTTGDAELLDGRVGANGVTYSNIGTAIRLQANEKIDGDINNNQYYWEAGAYNSNGNKVDYANDTHTRTVTFLPRRLKGISNNSSKKFDLLVYDKTGTFERVVAVANGTTVTFEENKLYNIHIAIPFTNIISTVENVVFTTKPNKYDVLIVEESNKTKKEIGVPVKCEVTQYDKVSIKPDGATQKFDGWYTSDFRKCEGYKYLVCEDVAFFKNVVLNALSFYDKDKQYIGGIYHPDINGESGNGYIRFTGSVKIPDNAYYFRDGKYKYNAIESKNLITLCDVEIPITKIKNEIARIDKEIEDLKNKKDEKDEKIDMGNTLCIGDSLTQGDYGSNPPGTINIKAENYPFYLNKYLNIFFKTNVINAGKCGFTATTYWESKVKNIDFTNVKTIVIMLGTNGYLTDTLEVDTTITKGQTYQNYANTHTGNYCKIIEYCLEKTSNLAQIILVTPPKTSQRDKAKMELLVEVIKKIGKKYSLKVIDGYNEFGIAPVNFNVMLPIDELHGGKICYKKIATYIGSNIISNWSYVIED